MIKNDKVINSLLYGDTVENIAKEKGISISEARAIVSHIGFSDYCKLVEAPGANITPPSGQTIGPSGPSSTGKAATAPSEVKAIWPGKGAPVEIGMTVGLKGPNGLPVPGSISQVDTGANGVKVKNPTTGEEEWMNMDQLETFMSSEQPGTPPQNEELSRLKQLAGIKENCSAGATGAGAIAMAPAPMGQVKRRQPTDEQAKVEYTPKAAKTVVGDTKPNQASGKLSADLAARGKRTASRKNNGFKR